MTTMITNALHKTYLGVTPNAPPSNQQIVSCCSSQEDAFPKKYNYNEHYYQEKIF